MKIRLLTLGISITQKCNLECKHCICGGNSQKEIEDSTLDILLSQISEINNLNICGGEPSLACNKISTLISLLKKYKITLHAFNTTTNAVIYNEQLADQLLELRQYVEDCKTDVRCRFYAQPRPLTNLRVSLDNFHMESLKEKKLDINIVNNNFLKYQNKLINNVNKCYSSDYNIINNGRAKNINTTVNKLPVLTLNYPILKDTDLLVGGIIMLGCDGDIIPINIPFSEEKIRSYGNVKDMRLEDIINKMPTIICKDEKTFYSEHKKQLDRVMY